MSISNKIHNLLASALLGLENIFPTRNDDETVDFQSAPADEPLESDFFKGRYNREFPVGQGSHGGVTIPFDCCSDTCGDMSISGSVSAPGAPGFGGSAIATNSAVSQASVDLFACPRHCL